MSNEKQIDIIAELLIDFDEMGFAPTTTVPDPEAYAIEWRNKLTDALQGYRKQSENVIESPCKVGDLVHFKGLETPWKVSAIHIYKEGQPQISITSETGKITSTMTANEFYMFCSVITEPPKMKGGADDE